MEPKMPGATAHVPDEPGVGMTPTSGTSNGASGPPATPFSSGVAPRVDEAKRLRKLRRHYLRTLQLIGASYLLDGSVMAMFWLAGTVGWLPSVAYTLSGLSLCAVCAALIMSGVTQRLRDPALYLPVVVVSSCIQLTAMALVPRLSFMFALILFIIYIAITLRETLRNATLAWIGVSAGVGLVLSLGDTRMTVPSSTLAEQMLSLGFFALTLWRCILLGSYNGTMSALLKKRGHELAELTRKVELLANHDELTGLLNRRSLINILEEEQLRAERTGKALSVAILDLDKFKSINDTLGHLAGDKTLKIFADTAFILARKTDRVGRYGGEEFLMIFIGTPAEVAQLPIERLRQGLREADWSEVASGFSVTFSCGIASYVSGETTEDMLNRADNALYRAKNEGRNCTRLG
jgi:diguanylate cyclase (GGDEF)-like protein